MLRVALSSLGPWPGGAGRQPGGGKGPGKGAPARPQLALAELVGLARRARVVVLRPADANSGALTSSGEALLAELESAAARALDAAAPDASASGLTGLPGAWGVRGPHNWARCDPGGAGGAGPGALKPWGVQPCNPCCPGCGGRRQRQ